MKDNKLLETLKAQAEVLSADVEFDGDAENMIRLWHRAGKRCRATVLSNFDFEDAINPDVFVNTKEYISFDSHRAALSAMKSLATKYRNNCDMLMQHRGVFKDEIEKLRAENAELKIKLNLAEELSAIDFNKRDKVRGEK